MAILFKASFLCFIALCCVHVLLVNCTEFEVGGKNGWVVPKSKDDYNNWASKNRFVVDDTVRFEYEKDSVLVVTEEEYHKCKSSRPLFFSNNGDTIFKFDRPGFFFFISGVSGHCDRGQKMIVKVLNVEAHSPQSQHQNSESSENNGAGTAQITPIIKATSALFVVSSFLGLLFA